MDLVLGLSITSAAVRLVLVEGTTGEGETVDHDVVDVATATDTHALLHNRVVAAARRNTLHSIGVTWTAGAATDGSKVLEALASGGFESFIAVSECDAADAVAAGIAGLAGYDNVGVCVVEPDAAVVAVVNPQGVLVDRIDRRLDGGDAAQLVRTLVAMLGPGSWTPEAVVVFGSAGDLDLVLSALRAAAACPVVSAAEPDLALAKGAALAAARAMSGWDSLAMPVPMAVAAPAVDDHGFAGEGRRSWFTPKVGALASVLAAAVLTFVVSLSLALGHTTPQVDEPEAANAAGPPTAAVKPPEMQPTPQPPAAPPPVVDAVQPPKSMAVEAAPVPEAEPVFDAPEAVPDAPPPVYGPVEPVPAAPAPEPVYAPPAPAPAYVPPAPAPVYVPPNIPAYTPPPEPRLRDRIIERIPILNRFHEPQPYNP